MFKHLARAVYIEAIPAKNPFIGFSFNHFPTKTSPKNASSRFDRDAASSKRETNWNSLGAPPKAAAAAATARLSYSWNRSHFHSRQKHSSARKIVNSFGCKYILSMCDYRNGNLLQWLVRDFRVLDESEISVKIHAAKLILWIHSAAKWTRVNSKLFVCTWRQWRIALILIISAMCRAHDKLEQRERINSNSFFSSFLSFHVCVACFQLVAPMTGCS